MELFADLDNFMARRWSANDLDFRFGDVEVGRQKLDQGVVGLAVHGPGADRHPKLAIGDFRHVGFSGAGSYDYVDFSRHAQP